MRMLVVDVRIVRVRVSHRLVDVGMGVRSTEIDSRRVFVLVVLIVLVPVVVFKIRVFVFVAVPLGQVQPKPNPHQCRRCEKKRRRALTKECDCKRRADERRCREVRAGSRRTQVPQPQNKKHQAQPVARQSQQCGQSDYARRRQRRSKQ